MAVPNTTNFTLQDVVDEINPANDTLTNCFAASIDDGFVSSYKGNKDRLSNFRGYNHSASYYGTDTIILYFASPGYGVLVGNTSTDNQNITYNWQYVSQEGDLNATVSWNGVSRNPGFFTSPNTTVSLSSLFDGFVEQPFVITGGNATTVTLKFQLLSASVDTVPNFPNNEFTVSVQHNY
jgi:hypothetical protein